MRGSEFVSTVQEADYIAVFPAGDGVVQFVVSNGRHHIEVFYNVDRDTLTYLSVDRVEDKVMLDNMGIQILFYLVYPHIQTYYGSSEERRLWGKVGITLRPIMQLHRPYPGQVELIVWGSLVRLTISEHIKIIGVDIIGSNGCYKLTREHLDQEGSLSRWADYMINGR